VYLEEQLSENQIDDSESDDPTTKKPTKQKCFKVMSYLFTLTLLLIPTPRSQAMKVLTFGTSTFRYKNGRFVIEVPGRLLKNNKTYYARIPKSLTKFYHMYIDVHRSILVGQSESQAVWVSRSGKRRKNMAGLTRLATRSCLGKQMTPHAFRSILASLMAAGPDGDDQTMANLARCMTHSRKAQKKHYINLSRQRMAHSLEEPIDKLTRKRKRSQRGFTTSIH
jgi:integrase